MELSIFSSQNIDFSEALRVIEEIERFRDWCRELPPKTLREAESIADVLDETSYGRDFWPDYYRDLETLEEASIGRAILNKRMNLVHKIAEALYPAVDQDGSSRISSSTRKSVMVRDEGTCQMCGRTWHRPTDSNSESAPFLPSRWEADFSPSEASVMDHIIPASFGGPGKAWNVWVLCSSCNQEKFRELWPPAIRRAVDRLRCGDGYKQIDPPQEQFERHSNLLKSGG